MDPAYTPVVKKITQEQAFVNGTPIDTVRIEYTVGNHGPFVERIAKADFDATKIQALMAATAATLQALGALSTQ